MYFVYWYRMLITYFQFSVCRRSVPLTSDLLRTSGDETKQLSFVCKKCATSADGNYNYVAALGRLAMVSRRQDDIPRAAASERLLAY